MSGGKTDLRSAHSRNADELMNALDSQADGLSDAEVERRRHLYGLNALHKRKRTSLLQILFRQAKNLVVGLLAIAALVAYLYGETLEATAIVAVLVVNGAIGFFMELSGVRSMEALMRMDQVRSTVIRQGRVLRVPAQDLVPGDIVAIEEGDTLSADMRVIDAARLESDESALTGESMPCAKQAEPVDEDTLLAERASMLYKGTVVTSGSGKALVVGTGMNTELGKISSLVESAEEEVTPLEKRLSSLGAQLVWVILIIVVITATLGILRGYSLLLMIEVAIALAVAAVPEGLPVVATVALSKGMLRMARRNGLVRTLSTVETLGSTTVICTDKTGTLTENKMLAARITLANGATIERQEGGSWPKAETLDLSALVRCASLCSNASIEEDGHAHGDPTETALLIASRELGSDSSELRAQYSEKRREPFDAKRRLMATVHADSAGSLLVCVKGAPEAVFALSLSEKEQALWQKRNVELAAQGFRVLALAEKHVESSNQDPYVDLNFLGLMALYDPPRADVREAIAHCHQAGIKVVMVTGDQTPTARFVGKELGIVSDNDERVVTSKDFSENKEQVLASKLVARVAPEDKLRLISWHQERGEIVAMTGDGVNDAPALKKADIGVAMGIRGTDVARDAADLILLDDAFSTIVTAISEGRVIFRNLRDFVRYLFSCNLAEILVIFLASLANAPLPLLPLQILFLNMVTDVFPALALGMSEGDGDELKRAPRPPGEEILTPAIWGGIVGHGVLISAATLTSLAWAYGYLKMHEQQAVSISFLTLGFAQLWHVFNMRPVGVGIIRSAITRNPHVWGGLILCSVLLWMTVYVPALALPLKTSHIGTQGWLIVGICSLLPVLADLSIRGFRILGRKRLLS